MFQQDAYQRMDLTLEKINGGSLYSMFQLLHFPRFGLFRKHEGGKDIFSAHKGPFETCSPCRWKNNATLSLFFPRRRLHLSLFPLFHQNCCRHRCCRRPTHPAGWLRGWLTGPKSLAARREKTSFSSFCVFG